MTIKILIALFLIGLATTCPARATEQTEEESEVQKAEWIALPFVFFTPDTGWGAGAAGTFSFARPKSDNPTSLQAVVIFTELKQVRIALNPDIYFGKNKWHWQNKFRYTYYPDTFYGLGPETTTEPNERYVEKSLEWSSKIEYNWLSDLSSGLIFDIQNTDLLDVADDPRLCQIKACAGQTGVMWGVGPLISWDSRDNIFYPIQGAYTEALWQVFPAAFGRTTWYHRTQIDARGFYSLFQGVIVAVQGVYRDQQGQVPFIEMSRLGEYLRGYKANRFRDEDLWMTQAELRLDVYDPVKAHLFIGAGNVFNSHVGNHAAAVKLAGGFGLRFRVNDDRLNLKFDMAFNRDNATEVYFGAQEAF